MRCRREGCPGVIPSQRVGSRFCCELCRVLNSKMSIEKRRLLQAQEAEKLEQLRAAWVELVAVADAVSQWRAALEPGARKVVLDA